MTCSAWFNTSLTLLLDHSSITYFYMYLPTSICRGERNVHVFWYDSWLQWITIFFFLWIVSVFKLLTFKRVPFSILLNGKCYLHTFMDFLFVLPFSVKFKILGFRVCTYNFFFYYLYSYCYNQSFGQRKLLSLKGKYAML